MDLKAELESSAATRPNAEPKLDELRVTTIRGTVRELLEFIFPMPDGGYGDCPRWPADVFAIVATLMRRNGAYVRSVVESVEEDHTPVRLLGQDWPKKANRIGDCWRSCIKEALSDRGTLDLARAVQRAKLPREVQDAWEALISRSSELKVELSRDDDALTRALLELSAYADEASAGIGLPGTDPTNPFLSAAQFFLTKNQKLSYCYLVDIQKARVLPKKHTPQFGLTLRSLTHHLSLCMPWEADAQWNEIGAGRVQDVVNILLFPWPFNVDATHFRCQDHGGGANVFRGYRKFTYRRPSEIEELEDKVRQAIAKAKTSVSAIHALVLPELAVNLDEWDVIQTIARNEGISVLVAGIIDDRDQKGRPINSCRILASDPPSGSDNDPKTEIPYSQSKHHRWCLDRGQILQYDLGGQLPSMLRCWEDTNIGPRSVSFVTLGGWLTFSVLICEDLARQDPIAEVMRSVGPNLVIALLMDGPQLAARWSARYASVLADDPGSSVLTLTSLGMAIRSRSASHSRGPFTPSRVIGLWKDKVHGTEEIALSVKSEACVLSLACARREEFTSDGRTDNGMTQVPVFSGLFELQLGSLTG